MSSKRKCKKHLAASAPGGTRTHTPRRTPEPKSGVSTNSTTGTLTYSIFARPPPKGQPVRPVGLEPTRPNKRGTGLSFRRVYHSTTGTKASQSRRTTGSYRSIIARPPARAQADNTRPHPNSVENTMLPWTVQDSNLRPAGCKPATLPTELTVQSVACGSRTRPDNFVNAPPVEPHHLLVSPPLQPSLL